MGYSAPPDLDSIMRAPILAITVLAACSCASAPAVQRPSCGEVHPQNDRGLVLYSDFDQFTAATISASVIDDYYDRTGSALGYSRAEAPEVWIVLGRSEQGATFDDHIIFDPSEGALEFAPLILAHEFVHWHSEGSAMQRNLPHVVMEGVSEWIAVDLTAEWSQARRVQFDRLLDAVRQRGDLPLLTSRLSLSRDAWSNLSGPELHETYALGFALVDRIGVDALREAAEQGPVSPKALLNMAGLRLDGGGL